MKIVNLIDHPAEYAMLQNNLGTRQYVSSSHTLENNLRALFDAYVPMMRR